MMMMIPFHAVTTEAAADAAETELTLGDTHQKRQDDDDDDDNDSDNDIHGTRAMLPLWWWQLWNALHGCGPIRDLCTRHGMCQPSVSSYVANTPKAQISETTITQTKSDADTTTIINIHGTIIRTHN